MSLRWLFGKSLDGRKSRGTESWSEGRTAEQFHGGIVEWEGRGRVRIGGIRVLFVLLNHFIIYLIIDLK